jgi:hypothetical protein
MHTVALPLGRHPGAEMMTLGAVARITLHRTGARAPVPRPRLHLLALAGATLFVISACGGQPSANLPPKATPLTAPTGSAASPSDSPAQAVASAYVAYFPVLKAAEAVPPAQAKAMLAPYAAQPYLGKVLDQMASYRAQDEVASGYVTPHVTKVTVNGRVAEVYDCQDASHATLTNTSTGKVTPPLKGSARTYLIASLARGSDGRWRLTSLAHVSVPCQPVPSPSS